MKLLVGYDGSRSSEAALDDLMRAGLPQFGEARVISVAESWDPRGSVIEANSDDVIDPEVLSELESTRDPRGPNQKLLTEARTFANHAKKRLGRILPKWDIVSHITEGSPARSILERAAEFDPDLLVLGSHGWSTVGQSSLGSISQKVLTEANCSVRVSRCYAGADTVPMRLIVGFDGSPGSEAAIDEVLSRDWAKHGEVRLIAAAESVIPSTLSRFVRPAKDPVDEIKMSDQRFLRNLANASVQKLHSAGLVADLHILPGNPKQVLVEEAEDWNADCIFVGAMGPALGLDKFVLGSTAAAIAARSQRSVEVVRPRRSA